MRDTCTITKDNVKKSKGNVKRSLYQNTTPLRHRWM